MIRPITCLTEAIAIEKPLMIARHDFFEAQSSALGVEGRTNVVLQTVFKEGEKAEKCSFACAVASDKHRMWRQVLQFHIL